MYKTYCTNALSDVILNKPVQVSLTGKTEELHLKLTYLKVKIF